MRSTVTKRDSWRALRLVWWAPVLLFLLAASGCSQLSLPPWKYPGYDANRTDVFPAAWNSSWRFERLSRTPLSPSMRTSPALFLGDVLGSASPEIVLVGENRVQIYDDRGKELRSIRLEGYDYLPGFLYDADRDGKLDIVLGSRGAPRPSLSILDGAGRIIDEYQVKSPSQDFERFIPWLNVDGAFFFVATENWPQSPRGIIRFSVSQRTEKWYFALPNKPVGLLLLKSAEGRNELLLSQFSTVQGTYPFLGLAQKSVFGYDSALHFLEIGLDGRILFQHTLGSNGSPLEGVGRFLPLSPAPGAPLLLRQDFNPVPVLDTYPHTPVFEEKTALHIVNAQTGQVTRSRTFGADRVLDLRILPDGPASDSRVLVLLHGRKGFRLDLLDSRLDLLRSRGIGAGSVSLGTVLSPSIGTPASIRSATRIFVLADDRLLLFDENLTSTRLLNDSGAREMLVSIAPEVAGDSNPPEGRLVLVGRDLEVYALRGR